MSTTVGSTSRADPGRSGRQPLTIVVGLAALVFSTLYFASDVWEALQGGFSKPQLVLTYVAEAAIPLFVIGLYAVQWPRIGTLGLVGALGYAYAYVFFTATVLLALVDRPRDWDALVGDLGPWVTVHGLLMVLAGTAFGVAVLRAGVLPRWTGITLLTGVVLVALSSSMPSLAQVASAGVRDLGFAAMGLYLLRRPTPAHAGSRPAGRTDVDVDGVEHELQVSELRGLSGTPDPPP